MGDAIRIDAGELAKPVETEHGYLRVDGYISRPGIYEYVNTPEDEKDGLGKAGEIRRELRPDDEVCRADAIDAFQGMPITLAHPKKHLDEKTARGADVGTVLSARLDGIRVAASLLFRDPKAIVQLKSRRKRQLSPGYRIREDRTPGVDPKYGRYDLVQRDIRPNHLALVERARGGADLAVRMDGITVSVERQDCGMDDDAGGPELVVMTTVVEGHQHTLDPADSSGRTSTATAEGADTGHSHEFVRGADGTITIAENAGHTHGIEPATLGVRGDGDLDAAERNNLEDSKFAYPEARKLPIENAEHVRAAMSRFSQTDFKAHDGAEGRAYKRIVTAAKKFGIDSSGFEKTHGSRSDGADRNDNREIAMDPQEQIRLLKLDLEKANQLAAERLAELTKASTRADSADAALKTAKERNGELEAKLAAGAAAVETKAVKEHATRADEAERKYQALEASIPKLIAQRCDSITKAQAVLGAGYTAVGKTDREIHVDVIKKLRPKDAVDPSVSDASISARFDSLIEDRTAAARSLERLDEAVVVRERYDAQDGERPMTPAQRADRWNNLAKVEGPRGYTLGGK